MRRRGAPAGSLSEELKCEYVSEAARRRLASLLDVLRRMRLVSASMGGEQSVRGQRRSELLDASLYAAEGTAQLEEPASAGMVPPPIPVSVPVAAHCSTRVLSQVCKAVMSPENFCLSMIQCERPCEPSVYLFMMT